ncbi:Putative transmembrane protein (Alph_Pro_TM) [Aquimixticola soesokkakensis]|uniref:Putative transmembrane protein (Alph_Pro_TM) n=1 Tax=Aquimixticola soesokkakensis TaxID=1519096 RepID=A0A1Y5SZW4_9RHOB|nr:TIGR02186 family protein [Aquimixticola soesokkakensis]SLN52999.1 Putative transmembrane protein (Alph_Pro_TM) [Aquimixticola soesokkakensis]
MRALVAVALWLLALVAPALGEEKVVASLSQNRVQITSDFAGSEILIFGAIKRDRPVTSDENLAVIVTVSGPLRHEVIRRKERRLGIWINVDATPLPRTPSFYVMTSTAPLADILPPELDEEWGISIDRAIAPTAAGTKERAALLRLREQADLYRAREGAIQLVDDTLFRVSVELPANLIEGGYQTRIFLLRDGALIDEQTANINVQKVGLERLLYNMAQQQALLYGALSLFIAIAAGWGASALFRYIRS